MSKRRYEYLWELKKVGEKLPTTRIQCSGDSNDYLKNIYSNLTEFQEHFTIVALDRANKTIGHKIISTGGMHGTVVDKVILAKYLVGMMASGFILCHNHPSGNVKPSLSDNKITLEVRDALKLFDIMLLDHIILGGNNYYSYADEGKL